MSYHAEERTLVELPPVTSWDRQEPAWRQPMARAVADWLTCVLLIAGVVLIAGVSLLVAQRDGLTAWPTSAPTAVVTAPAAPSYQARVFCQCQQGPAHKKAQTHKKAHMRRHHKRHHRTVFP